MHTRKKFLIYPPEYKPGGKYLVRHSKLQAWKTAVRMGEGATVVVDVFKHPKRCRDWISSCLNPLWEITFKGDK